MVSTAYLQENLRHHPLPVFFLADVLPQKEHVTADIDGDPGAGVHLDIRNDHPGAMFSQNLCSSPSQTGCAARYQCNFPGNSSHLNHPPVSIQIMQSVSAPSPNLIPGDRYLASKNDCRS
jgi:hypothetical protein